MQLNNSKLIYWDNMDPYNFCVGNTNIDKRRIHSEKEHFNDYNKALNNGVCNWEFINK